MTWYDRALCAQVGPTFFFPEPGEAVEQAKRVCAKCPVRLDCLADAISVSENNGIRAGFDMQEIYMTTRKTRGRAAPRKVAAEMLRRNECSPQSSASTATKAA